MDDFTVLRAFVTSLGIGLLMGLEWNGPDAERVRASWQEQERRHLDTTAEHLMSLVALIRQSPPYCDSA